MNNDEILKAITVLHHDPNSDMVYRVEAPEPDSGQGDVLIMSLRTYNAEQRSNWEDSNRLNAEIAALTAKLGEAERELDELKLERSIEFFERQGLTENLSSPEEIASEGQDVLVFDVPKVVGGANQAFSMSVRDLEETLKRANIISAAAAAAAGPRVKGLSGIMRKVKAQGASAASGAGAKHEPTAAGARKLGHPRKGTVD